ncbi:MAG TPA: sigma 54-interacting transcriptional regulator [Planctomycetota bacterium]|nr:sigma 54-interacting transcriptional regulator [Planctomycetota bacterium]OQC19853.1 MAG: Transcriptional regulatory protein ZraR [Planctomycetes bacterium ADurb.Bin069]HNR99467.1 sigma 54-interacting transcriptional regulator [Planctomycetota bacterium]HNU26344.1 sigma 54-interacting transcriptional regulator [Planctomycetota bacterium]HOE30521.1 sigma 54-interacting transcriptional regulator [Planctomycetota bacterium]
MSIAVARTPLSGRVPALLRRLRNEEDPAALIPSILAALAQTKNAERALLVEARGEDLRVPWSATIEGDAVIEAARRAPADLLRAARPHAAEEMCAGAAGLPAEIAREFQALDKRGAVLVRLGGQGELGTWLYLENRFCELAAGQDIDSAWALDIELLRLCLWIMRLRGELAQERDQRTKAEALVARMNMPGAGVPVPAAVQDGPRRKGGYARIVTCSPRMHAIFAVLDKIAHTAAPVLIMGESGTGKELVAMAIHENSPRAGKPFIPENCAALTETLLESELFGYKRGAFTGANADRKGLFEMADGGTLFLDEVGEMSLNMQKKLLRVLQENVIRPVGGKDLVPVDARIISATNRDLVLEVQEGQFREDLYYRLNVITIDLPPLRERLEDVPLLVRHFLEELARKHGAPKRVAPEALEFLGSYHWPGNVRELHNEIQRVYALAGETIEARDLSVKIRNRDQAARGFTMADLELLPLKQAVESFEREFLRRALARFSGSRSRIAQTLGVPKTSLYQKLQKYGLMGTA